MRSEERAARRAKWPKWDLVVRVVLANGWADTLAWQDPIPAASLQAIVNRAPKYTAATLKDWQIAGRSKITSMVITIRKAT